jgi:hypothetical protein
MNIKSNITQNLTQKLNNIKNTKTEYILKSKKISIKKNKDLYPINEILRKDYENIQLNPEQRIFTAVYQINTTALKPFIEYTLFKFPKTDTDISDLFIFPFKKPTKNLTPLQIALKIKNNIKKDKAKCKGFLLNENGAYFFFEDKLAKNTLELKPRNTKKWWVTIDEICNHRNILNFPIHQSVTNIFYQFPTLIYLYENNQKIETPTIAYFGEPIQKIAQPAVFGRRNQLTGNYGPFFYFSGYTKAIQYASYKSNIDWKRFNRGKMNASNRFFKPNKKQERKLNKDTPSGILRIIIFLGKTKYLTNSPDDCKSCEKKDIYTYLKKIDFTENKEYDSLYVGRAPLSIKNKIYYNSFSIIAKKFKQQHVLSIHTLNIQEFPNIFNRFYNKFFIK